MKVSLLLYKLGFIQYKRMPMKISQEGPNLPFFTYTIYKIENGHFQNRAKTYLFIVYFWLKKELSIYNPASLIIMAQANCLE